MQAMDLVRPTWLKIYISADYTIKVAKVFQQNWQKTELISMIIKMIKT